MDLNLKDKVAIVTAASRGLGFATARALALEGARVVICSRNWGELAVAADSIAQETDADVIPVVADVMVQEDVANLRDTTLDHFGRIDLLYTNAGGPPPGTFVSLTPEDWETATQLTVQSVVQLIYAVLPTMRAQKSGAILANTSVTVRHPLDNLILSNSLRMAVVGLVKSLSIELGPENIRVNAIAPGWTRTERVDQILASRAGNNGTTIEAEAAKITDSVPLRRMAAPTEYARVAAFLLSPAASYVTGVTLLVDGGLSRAVV